MTTMPTRKTESRIPDGLQASDLGQAVPSGDGHCTLVSLVSSPVVVNRENVYVVFVTDAGLAAATQSYEWTFTEEGSPPTTQTAQAGEVSYTPHAAGSLSVRVRLLGAGDAEQAAVTMAQDAVATNAELEELIANARNDAGPTIANPEVARELVNDHNPYYQGVTVRAAATGESFQKIVFNVVYGGALLRTAAKRKQHAAQLAAALNTQTGDFATLAREGVGVAGIRLALLAMATPQSGGSTAPILEWTELPEPAADRATADEQLRQRLGALDENTRIDLFNRARFPKSNIVQCGRILEALRDRYFSAVDFNDVLSGMSGTRAQVIVRHFREGPIR
jgi:hypothetical protein